MSDLTGRTALVTGSARGVGKAVALRYASLGANVVVNYSGDTTNAERTVEEIRALGVEAIAVRADVSRVEEIDRLFAEAADRFGRVDIVVANAGVEIIDQPMLEATEKDFDRLYAINAKGTFFTLQRAAMHIADNGRIIYIGSSTTCNAFPGVGLYGSSKMGARYLVQVLAMEVGNRGITVNTILPTTIEGAGVFTDIADDDPYQQMSRARPLGGRMGRPDDVADAAEYFAGPLASWVSGQALLVSGGAQQ
ncbi:SDR family oxidoreductase [Pseudonocardia kongjuensis]|uniref:SDR family oxidoreductase n=1 Tax=Pseudonocardia kongjuensis TaxID=102227 RepID=A0ABN1Y056_9PSEU